ADTERPCADRRKCLRVQAEASAAAAPQSIRTFAASTTARHFAVSCATKLAKFAGEPGLSSTASFASAARTGGAASASFAAALSFPTISAGVPAGATRPGQETGTESGTAAPAMV